MRTADAVTTMHGLNITLILFTVLYLLLAVIVIWLMISHIIATPDEEEIQAIAASEVLVHA
jgi:cytochrome bd-type quinol oxidase subunit 1